MARIPQEVTSLFSDPQAAKVMATVDAEGTVYASVRGKFNAADEETVAFADIAHVKRRPEFRPGQGVSIAVFKLPNFGYQIHGAFQGYQTSGEIFDTWAAMLKEGPGLGLDRVGLVKVDQIYSYASEDRSEHGTRIA